MTLKDELPDEPEVAHALIRQKLNEHTDAIHEVRKENEKQNRKIDLIDAKVDAVKEDTKGIVDIAHTMKSLCRLIKIAGAIAGAVSAIIGLVAWYKGWM